jgi:hypothetical protein
VKSVRRVRTSYVFIYILIYILYRQLFLLTYEKSVYIDIYKYIYIVSIETAAPVSYSMLSIENMTEKPVVK